MLRLWHPSKLAESAVRKSPVRYAIRLMGGKLFAGDVLIRTDDCCGRLHEDVLEALSLPKRFRLLYCGECRKRFIAHYSNRTCSPECNSAVRARTQEKATLLLTERRRHYRKDAECASCAGPVRDCKRVRSRMFCSPACRQAAYRKRRQRSARQSMCHDVVTH
jgi:hypothetical protein